MLEIEKIAENLFDKIRSRFDGVSIGDENAKSTLDPENARFFNFDYSVPSGRPIGNITLSLVDDNNLKVYFDKDLDEDMTDDEKDSWYDFLKGLRKFAKRNLLTFDIRDIAKSGLDLRDLKHANKDAEILDKDDIKVTESRLSRPFGTSRSTYQTLENVRIIARHSKKIVDETKPGARSRNVECFYIENSLGERFRLPEGTTFNGARAYANHVRKGGLIQDDFGHHIGRVIKEMNDLKLFVRNMRGRTFEDTETNSMVEAAIDHYGSLHRDLHTIKSSRGYDEYRKLWQPELMEDDFDLAALKERFVKRVFDDRLMDALPVVQRAYDKKRNRVGEEFEAWANNLIDESEGEPIEVNNNSPLANSISANNKDSDGNVIDGDAGDEKVSQLFNANDFEFVFSEGTYFFQSREELERAKDIIAADNPRAEFPPMAVRDPEFGNQYGAAGQDREFPDHGVAESLDSLKWLAGLTK